MRTIIKENLGVITVLFVMIVYLTTLPFLNDDRRQLELHEFDKQIEVSDYVFDLYYDGKMNKSDMEKFPDFKILDINQSEAFIKHNRHLPYIYGREYWDRLNEIPIEKLVSQQWVAIEVLWLHVIELNKELEEIELLLEYEKSSISIIESLPIIGNEIDFDKLHPPDKLKDSQLIELMRFVRENQISDARISAYKREFEIRRLSF
jgi:uncharacterized radical SAM superfamily protein